MLGRLAKLAEIRPSSRKVSIKRRDMFSLLAENSTEQTRAPDGNLFFQGCVGDDGVVTLQLDGGHLQFGFTGRA